MSVNSIAIKPLGGPSRAAFTPSPTSVRPVTDPTPTLPRRATLRTRHRRPFSDPPPAASTPQPSIVGPNRTPRRHECKCSHPAKMHLLLAKTKVRRRPETQRLRGRGGGAEDHGS